MWYDLESHNVDGCMCLAELIHTHTHTHTCMHTAKGSKSVQYGAPAITGEGSESDRQAFCRKGHYGLTA